VALGWSSYQWQPAVSDSQLLHIKQRHDHANRDGSIGVVPAALLYEPHGGLKIRLIEWLLNKFWHQVGI
jgi:hypothetical protein